MAYLILVRHGQSEWNLLNQFTGWTDVELTEDGCQEARKAANLLHDITIHRAHTSDLKRAQQTLDIILKEKVAVIYQLINIAQLRNATMVNFLA